MAKQKHEQGSMDPALTKPHVGTRAMAAFVRHLESRCEENEFRAIIERCGLPYEYLVDEQNWVSLAYNNKLLLEVAARFDILQFAREAGRLAVSEGFIGKAAALIVRSVYSPQEIFEKVPRYSRLFNVIFSPIVLESRDGYVRFHFKPDLTGLSALDIEDFRKSARVIIENTAGYFEAIAGVRRGGRAEVVISEVGAEQPVPAYELIVRYRGLSTPKPFTAGFAVAVGALAFSLVLASSLLAVHAAVTIGVLTGFLFYFTKMSWDLRRLLRETANESEASMESIASQFRELHNAQIQLLERERQMLDLQRKEAAFKISRQVAHDIRSPLSAIRFVCQRASGIDDGMRSLLGNAVTRVEEIAAEVMAASNEKGDKILSLDAKALVQAIAAVVGEKNLIWGAGGHVAMRVDSFRDESRRVQCDDANIKRVLANIIQNAIEANPRDNTVEVRVVESGAGIVISVLDKGEGIPEELLSKVAEEGLSFGKGNMKGSGAGLGLYHAKEVIEGWGGLLQISSRVGEGTKVSLTMAWC
jgi:signal transduction histidine kinase